MADRLIELLHAEGYRVQGGDTLPAPGPVDEAFRFIYLDEVGEAMPTELQAWADAMEHFFAGRIKCNP